MRADELAELQAWLGAPPRHPHQTHEVNESDAEVVQLPNGSFLAVSVDAIGDEIASGLYRDPYTIGWVTAIAGLADIAAVGAIGVLLTATWGRTWDAGGRARVGAGFADALRAHGTALLGGDTGRAGCTVLSVSAIGRSDTRPLSRVGALAGDILGVTGRVGGGAVLGARLLLGDDGSVYPEDAFRPVARLMEGVRLRELASACTDTSDGLIEAVQTLAATNGLGASLGWTPAIVDEFAASYFAAQRLPLWLTWMAEIGDYELLFAVPERSWAGARAAVPGLTAIGRLTDGGMLSVTVEGTQMALDGGPPGFAATPPEQRRDLLERVIAGMRAQGLP